LDPENPDSQAVKARMILKEHLSHPKPSFDLQENKGGWLEACKASGSLTSQLDHRGEVNTPL
jgi:hypothetical protein